MATRGIQKPFTDGDGRDRISSLPRNLIALIMGYLPVRDAARTCVLSTRWRYAWTNQTSLVLDEKFWNDIKNDKLCSSEVTFDFAGIVNSVLLRHIGSIQNFVVDISVISSQRHCDVDLWLSLLCSRALKVLCLKNSASIPYTIPSRIFSNPGLTNLSISGCIFNTNNISAVFNGLQSLTLDHLTLGCCVINAPVLTSLTLKHCLGVSGFNISAPKLVHLTLFINDDLNLVPYLICKNITCSYIYVNKNIEQHKDIPNVNILKLFSCWPKMSHLLLDGPVLKYLATGVPPEKFYLVWTLTLFVPFRVHVDEIHLVLCLLQKAPYLEIFEIWLFGVATNDLQTLKYLEDPSFLNMRMEKLHMVKLRFFKGSRSELQFVKILLHCSPLLKQMFVEEDESQDLAERFKISNELMRFPRASTKAEVIFGQHPYNSYCSTYFNNGSCCNPDYTLSH